MIKTPYYGQTVYAKNTGTASTAPYLSGKIDSHKMIGQYWSVITDAGRRKLYTPDELYESMEELTKEG